MIAAARLLGEEERSLEGMQYEDHRACRHPETVPRIPANQVVYQVKKKGAEGEKKRVATEMPAAVGSLGPEEHQVDSRRLREQ